MIVVRVELHSAVTGEVSEIARMHIANVGGTGTRGDYDVKTLWGRKAEDFAARRVQRAGAVTGHARLHSHVWNLVAKGLTAMGYGT